VLQLYAATVKEGRKEGGRTVGQNVKRGETSGNLHTEGKGNSASGAVLRRDFKPTLQCGRLDRGIGVCNGDRERMDASRKDSQIWEGRTAYLTTFREGMTSAKFCVDNTCKGR
jgi:hypothetical protein